MDTKDFIFPGVILGLVIIIGLGLLLTHGSSPTLIPIGSVATSTTTSTASTTQTSSSSTSTPVSTGTKGTTTHTPTPNAYYPYGTLTLALNQAAVFKDGMSMRPTAVLEDSRCPMGVFCIQAGTTKISLVVRSGDSARTETIQLGRSIIVGNDTITFDGVTPPRSHTGTIAPSDYRFTFTVTPKSASNQCYVGGCSSELCTNSPHAVSSCIYRSEYACYKNATCERQANGACGWTQDHALLTCLAGTS